jgi:hypothetical protein
MLFTKREIAEMMLRPQCMPESISKELTEYYMRVDPFELVRLFSKSTKLRLTIAGNNLFEIRY